MNIRRIIASILIATLMLTLVGCSKKEPEVIPRDLRTEYFTLFEESLTSMQGIYQLKLDYQYGLEDENSNPMANSLVQSTASETASVLIEGLIDSDKNIASSLTFSSSEYEVKDLKLLEFVISNKSLYLNIANFFNNDFIKMIISIFSDNKDDGYSIDEELLEEEISEIKDLYNSFVVKKYIMINLEELLTFAKDFIGDEEQEALIDELYDGLIPIGKELSYKIKEIEKLILITTFKYVENSYPETLIKYNEEKNYYYINFNETSFKDFLQRLYTFQNDNLEKMLDAAIEQVKLQETLDKVNNLVNELEKKYPGTQNILQEVLNDSLEDFDTTLTVNNLKVEDFDEYLIDTMKEIFESINDFNTDIDSKQFTIDMLLTRLENGYQHAIMIKDLEDTRNFANISFALNKSEEKVIAPTSNSFSIIEIFENLFSINFDSSFDDYDESYEEDDWSDWE